MSAKLALGLALLLSAGPALAQHQPSLPGQPGIPAVSCGPSNNSPACQALRQAAPGGAIPGLVERPLADPPPLRRPHQPDIAPRRMIPPSIRSFLQDPRIDPLTRAFLLDLAGKRNEDWSLQDLRTLGTLIPSLTELHVPTARLGELYGFLGLDPTHLFEPQLGEGWQSASTAQESFGRGRRNGHCARMSSLAQSDPTQVRVQEMLDCQSN